jgi:hypothetical protein
MPGRRSPLRPPPLGPFHRMVWAGSLISSQVRADESPMDFIPTLYSTALLQTRSSMGAGEDLHSPPGIPKGPLMARGYKSEDALTT